MSDYEVGQTEGVKVLLKSPLNLRWGRVNRSSASNGEEAPFGSTRTVELQRRPPFPVARSKPHENREGAFGGIDASASDLSADIDACFIAPSFFLGYANAGYCHLLEQVRRHDGARRVVPEVRPELGMGERSLEVLARLPDRVVEEHGASTNAAV
jgi:hypothetical protein